MIVTSPDQDYRAQTSYVKHIFQGFLIRHHILRNLICISTVCLYPMDVYIATLTCL